MSKSKLTAGPEQLSLFDWLGNAGEPETVSVQEPAMTTVPTQVTATVTVTPTVTQPKEQKKDTEKKLTHKEKVAMFMKEPAFKKFRELIDECVPKKDIKSILDYLHIEGFHAGGMYYAWDGSRQIPVVWKCLGGENIKTVATNFDERDSFVVLRSNYNKSSSASFDLEINCAYVSEETAEMIIIPIKAHVETEMPTNYRSITTNAVIDEMSIEKEIFPTKIIDKLVFLQSEGELSQIVGDKKPWIVKWLAENTAFSIKRYLEAPWLETLSKAGFDGIAKRFLYETYTHRGDIDIEYFNRLCGPGRKPKEIFKCSKMVYSVMKDESDLEKWDVIRRLDKKNQITEDSLRLIRQMDLRPKDLNIVNSILNVKDDDNYVFTVASLVNYLNRLDMYEAITDTEALPLLNDYLHMCSSLKIHPRIDGDSLKREHDIAARLCREQRNQIMANKMKERAEKEKKEIEEGNSKLGKAEYHENTFFVRPITDYEDLLDEAKQQCNCVASYADRIARGQSRIFTMRESAHPEKSLITIELSPDCKTIRQKYLAHNIPIRNKAQSDFIARWHKQLNA